MYDIRVTIEGVAPLLLNRMADPSSLRAPNRRKSDDELRDEATARAYRDADGIYLPEWNVKRMILDGCRKAGIKDGKASAVGNFQGQLFLERNPHFVQKDVDSILEVVGRIPPRTGAAAVIRRPMLNPGWRLPFTIHVVDNRRDPDSIRRSIEEAGLLVGLGSWRPEYGRFGVIEFA